MFSQITVLVLTNHIYGTAAIGNDQSSFSNFDDVLVLYLLSPSTLVAFVRKDQKLPSVKVQASSRLGGRAVW